MVMSEDENMNKQHLDNHQHDEKWLDDQLAMFTDQVLSGSDVSVVQDADLQALQKTVLMLKANVSDEQPNLAMVERMRGNLALEWKKMERSPATVERSENVFERLRRWLMQPGVIQPRTFALGMAALFVAALIIVFVSSPGGTPPMGTAWGPSGWLPLAAIGLTAIVALIWYLRSRR